MALNSATIKSIQDIMRKDAGVDGDAQRLGQLTWLLFLKIFDDREQEWEITVKKYRSPIPEELRWRNWAADTEGLTGDGLLDFINNQLFPSLKGLSPEASPRHRVIHDVFEDAYQYMKNGTLVRQVINKINESLDFNRSEDRHIFGDLYEQILNPTSPVRLKKAVFSWVSWRKFPLHFLLDYFRGQFEAEFFQQDLLVVSGF